MEPLEIEVSMHVEHIKDKFADLTIDELKAKRKEISGNKKARADVGRTSFNLGMEIAEGLFKTVQSIYPKYIQAVGYTTREEERQRVTDGKIEKYMVTMYKIEKDVTANFKGVDVTESEAVKHLSGVDAADENLTPEELIRKYQVSENLFFMKEALKNKDFANRTLEFRRAKVLASLHTLTIQAIDQMIAEAEMSEHDKRVERLGAFMTPEGRQKLFGL